MSNRQQGLLDTKRSEVRTDADALAPQADSKLDVSHLRNQAVALEKEVENAMLYPANLIHSRSLQLDVYDREHYAFVPSKANPEEGYWRRNGLPSGTELVLGTWQDIQKKYGPEYKDHQSMKRHVVTRYKTPEGQTRSFYFYDDHAFSVPYALEALERPNEIAASEGLTHLFLDDHSDRAGVPQVIFPKTFAEAVHLMADKETLNGLRMNNFNAFWAPGLLTRHVHLYDSQVALPSDYQRLSGQIKIELPLPGGALSVSMDTPLYFSQYSDRPRDDQNSVFVDVDTDINGGGDSVTKPIRPADEIFSFYSDVFGRLVFDDKVSPALFHASTTTSPHASYGDVEIVRYLARVAPLFFIAGPLHARDEILTAVKAIGTEHKDLIRRSEVRKNRAGFTPEQQQVVRETAEWFIRSQRGFRNDLAGLSEVEQKRVDQLVLKTRVMRKTLRGFLRMAWWRWRSGLSQVLQQKANIPLGLIWMFGLTLTGAFSLPLQFFVYVVEPYWAFGLANRNSGIVEISPEALTNTRLFKKVLIHEWVHLYEMNPRQAKPAQNDNDALGFIAQLENAQVAFTEESILNAYPSPLLKSAFKSIQDQGFQTTLEGYRNVGDIERRKALFAAELHFKEGFYSGIRLPRSEGLHKTASILYKTYTQTVSEYFKLFFAARLNLARQITTREAPIEDYVAQTGALALMLHAVNTQFPEASDAEKYHLAKVFFWASLDIGLELGLRSFDRRIKTTAESSLHSHWRMRVDRDGLQRVIEAYPNIRRELFEELDWIVQKAEVLQPDVDPRVSIDLHVKPLTDRSYLKEWKIKKSGRDEYSFWLSIQSQADRNHWISHELFILKKNAIFPKRAEVRQSGQPPARKPAQNTIGKALARELFGQIVQDGMVHSDTAEDVAGLSVVRLDEVIQRLEMMLENARADWHAEGLDGTAYVAASLGLISELLSIVQKLKTEYPEGAEVGLAIAEGIDRLGSEQIADQHARALTSLGGLINRMIVIGRLSAHFQEMLNESGFKGIKLTLEGRAQNVKAPDGQARVPVVEVGDSLNGGIIPPEILRVLLGQEGYDMGADTYSFYTLSAAVALQYAYSVIVALKLKKEMDPAEISQELLDQLGLKTENALVMDGDKMRVMVNVVRSLITEFQTRSEIRKAA